MLRGSIFAVMILFTQIIFCESLLENVDCGFYGSLGVRGARIDNSSAMLLTPSINLLVKPHEDHVFSSGLELNYLVTNTTTETSPYRDGMQYGYGGVRIGYTPFYSFIVHPTVSLLVGGGSVKTEEKDVLHTEIEDEFFLLEPELDVEVNITSFFRISGFVSYRFLMSVDHPTLKSADLDGISGGLKLNFGSF